MDSQESSEPKRRRGRRRALTRAAHLKSDRSLAVALITTILSFATVFIRIPEIVQKGFTDPVEILSLGLTGAAVVLIIAWFYATDRELDALFEIGAEFLVPLPSSELVLVVGAALGLGALVLASAWPLAFAAVYTLLKLVELWSSWPLHRQIRDSIASGRAGGLSTSEEAAVQVVEAYYFGRPWVQLTTVLLAVSSISMAVAAYEQGLTDGAPRAIALSIVAVALICAVVGGELVVGTWRRTYFRQLEPVLEAMADERDRDSGRSSGA